MDCLELRYHNKNQNDLTDTLKENLETHVNMVMSSVNVSAKQIDNIIMQTLQDPLL